MKNNSFNNNEAINNNNNFGGITMTNGTIKTMDVFAGTIKVAVEETIGAGYVVEIHEVIKNNDTHLTGLTIRNEASNIAPTIYLNGYFDQYKDGAPLAIICNNIIATYEEHKVTDNFDVTIITDFTKVQDKICYKLVNAQSNHELLKDAPHKIVCDDLAVIFYVLVSQDNAGTASVTVRNNLMELWNVSVEVLYDTAMANTQRLFRGSVRSMADVMMEILADRMDEDNVKEFYDMVVSPDDMIPMYVCSNTAKLNGAGVILYHDLLKEFAERTGADFYILPSSIHETLLIPQSEIMDVDYLRQMVNEVNSTEVAPEEILSNHVYRYSRETDSIELA